MPDDLYERYKEALRVGHVAVLRGALEEAIDAYRNAASIAPSRALPHTSLGGVMLRLSRLEEALTEYAAAVARAPHDEAALLGQAEALATAGQRTEAARALDHVSEIQETAGRLPEAADTLRRALDLEDLPERSQRQRALLREIRLSAGDQVAEEQLARALRLRDEPQVAGSGSDRGDVTKPAQSVQRSGLAAIRWEPEEMPLGPAGAAGGAAAAMQPAAVAESSSPQPTPAGGTTTEVEHVAAAAGSSPEATSIGAAAGVEPPPELVGVMAGAVDATTGPAVEAARERTGDELLAAAEAAEVAGDNTALRSLLVGTARAYAGEGRLEAALDAVHRLLQRVPGDVDAHLVLVELYVTRNWNGLAAEKLLLLDRLADLNGDRGTHERLCAVATRAFPNDERLAALCA